MINNSLKKFTSVMYFQVYDDDSIEDAKHRFEELKKEGVIKDETSFDDETWMTTDQYANIGLHFEKFNEFCYQKYYQQIFNMTFDCFKNTVKAFMVSQFGRHALIGIYQIQLELRHLIETDPQMISEEEFEHLVSWEPFITSIINDENESGISFSEMIEDYRYDSRRSSQRTLADYDTYFLFDELIKRFWQEELTKEERLFYYPVYIWWILTNVIPQRPREFLLMPRDCLSFRDGKYHISFRRNMNKGFSKKRVYSYKIDKAYRLDEYPVPDYVGRLISDYISLTEDQRPTELNTLFMTASHYQKWGISNKHTARYFTLTNFRTVLNYFYAEIIQGRYGYTVTEKSEGHLKDGEIGIIHPGDTRHIALINLMQSGGTPFLGMLFAGHADKDMASHYYSNVTKFIQCKTFRQYRNYITGAKNYEISYFTEPMKVKYADSPAVLESGRCSSEKYQNSDYSDCLNVAGEHGEIGYCPACPYYIDDRGYATDEVYQRNLKADCKALADAITLVRQEKGYPEDVAEIINRLKGTGNEYSSYLMYKQMKEGGIDGTSKDDR